jgi:putative hydrolase of the HAD superfamily
MDLNLAKISIRHSSFVIRNSIKNLIFDFGGVICNIDLELTKQAFSRLGLKKFDTEQSIIKSSGLFEELETGQISPGQFRVELRNFFDHPVADQQIDAAWNALLLDIPEPRIRMLEALRQRYRIFLLSNTNEIHYQCYANQLREKYGYAGFDALFEKAWFSFRIGLKKPSTEIFRHVLSERMLNPSETLFIDDTLMHVEGARNAGIHAYHLALDQGEDVMDLFIRHDAVDPKSKNT